MNQQISTKPETEPSGEVFFTDEEINAAAEALREAAKLLPDALRQFKERAVDNQRFHNEVQERIKRGARRTSGRIV